MYLLYKPNTYSAINFKGHSESTRTVNMPDLMNAVVVEKPGGPEELKFFNNWKRPKAGPGEVLIRVKAFGLNRGELLTRQGFSPTVNFPRVLGIECVGIVEEENETNFVSGQKVVATTGGMGRLFDGSYAEFVSVSTNNVYPVETKLSWTELAAIPEIFHTAWGALELSLNIQKNETLLVRGGSVITTTRDNKKFSRLKEFGAEHVILDQGNISSEIRKIAPNGIDKMFDLIGTRVLVDSFACIRKGGVLCMAGLLGGEWVIDEFAPGGIIPSTTKFTYFSSSSTPMDSSALNNYVTGLEKGLYRNPLSKVFSFKQIRDAHSYMETNQACGKIVVTLS